MASISSSGSVKSTRVAGESLMSRLLLRRSWRPASMWATRGASCTAPRIMCTHVGAGSGGRSGGVVVRSPPEDLPYTVKGLKHISIAVPDLASAAEHYRCAFGAQVSAPVDQLDEGVKVVYVKLPNVAIELLHPLEANSAVAKFLEKNPTGGIHHLCFAVDDLNSASRYLEDLGVERINDDGSLHQQPALNLHPKDTMGVRVQLQQAN